MAPGRIENSPMLTYVHQALLWGLLAVSIPILIHLINMLRHRRVEWAAMEFLLVSQKKHRTWIIFKQLLLLMMRMLAIAVIVFIVAQPLLDHWLGRLAGTTKTHHVVLMDDSFSMSDRWADKSAFGEAKAVVKQIGEAAALQTQDQTFTLLRFSRIIHGTKPHDLLEEPVNKTEFRTRLDETLQELEASQTSAGPVEALKKITKWLGDSSGQRRIYYLVSDFRSREWDDPAELQKQLRQLNEAEAEIYLINCVDQTRQNLAITSLGPAEGIRAVGVPWYMEVTVKNFGTTLQRKVQVFLHEEEQEEDSIRPVVTIPEIPPGDEVTKRFEVHYGTAGLRKMTARLKDDVDAVAADNLRHTTADVPINVPVLLIDGSPNFRDSKYLNAALAPGEPARTGVDPLIKTPDYLTQNRPLNRFHAIILMNVARLDKPAIEALEQYAAAGGGLAIFLGERCRKEFINNELYRNGEGFFPLPLVGEAPLLVDRLEPGPDLQVEEHPIFGKLTDRRYSMFLRMVMVQRYFAAREGWKPDPDSTTRVIARLRNSAPLVVERDFGRGRVVAFLTTVAPTAISMGDNMAPLVWNNWARNNPSFVVAMLNMLKYLSRRSPAEVPQRVGSKLKLELDGNEYEEEVSFFTPGDDHTPIMPDDIVKENTKDNDNKDNDNNDKLLVSFSDTGASGIYRVRLTKRHGGKAEDRHYAFNVDEEEGDLTALSGDDLAARLKDVSYHYEQAAALRYAVSKQAGSNISDWLLYLLIVLLIGEQVLAWSASYHRSTRPGIAGAKGGVR